MSWKDTITAWSTRVLKRRRFPVPLKELAWRLGVFVAKCGRSHPISFALRPVMTHRKLRIVVGVNLAILMGLLAIYGPLPTFAGDSVGGRLEINIHPEGEVNLSTPPSVRIPLANYHLTQGFYWFHPGVDLATQVGEPVYPVMPGRVAKAEYGYFGYGNHILLTHANGYETLYAHLSKIDVSEGQTVNLESKIGEVGSTGRSTGSHLHLEIRTNNSPVNPKSILDLR